MVRQDRLACEGVLVDTVGEWCEVSRTAVVTGGGSGLGRSIALKLADDGHRVAVMDVDGNAVDEVVAEIRATGAAAMGLCVDVSDESAVEAGFASVRAEYGPVEMVVTSAAIAGFTRFDKITLDEW